MMAKKASSGTKAVSLTKGSNGRKQKIWIAWVLVAPALLIRSFTTLYPFLKTFYNSLFNLSLFKRSSNGFVGLQNFIDMMKDSNFLKSLEFTAIFTAVSMVFHIVLGVCLALLLNQKFKGRKLLRTVTLLPWAMPMVVVGIAAKWAFNGEYGLVNDVIGWFTPGFHYDWLVYKGTARAAVIAVDLWKDVPFFAILVLSSLQFIPEELYESARVDGSNAVNSFFHITLPLITKNILTLTIFFTMWRMTSFDIVYAMTSGGPANATSLLANRISMEAFSMMNLGYASAIAVFLFLVMAVLSLINSRAISKIED